MSASRTGKLWSSLSAGRQQAYRNQGITSSTYNAWNRRAADDKAFVNRLAKEAGYKSGLQFTAVRTEVRRRSEAAGRPVSAYAPPRTLPPREAARRLIRGAHGRTNLANRRKISQLFPQTEDFSRPEWDEFMSA